MATAVHAVTATPATTTTQATHGETIHTTANHPWLTADHGWTLAGTLQVGEPVREADGRVATVEAVRVVPGAASMWDLTVSNVHTFAVGSGAFVVHNCSSGETVDDVRQQAQNSLEDSLKDPHTQKSMNNRGWTKQEISDTLDTGDPRTTADLTNGGPASPERATRFTNPNTGRAVTVNNRTGRIVMLGEKDFLYDFYDDLADRLWP